MINLFLIVYDFSGARTYADEISAYLKEKKDIFIFQIYLNNKVVREFSVLEKDEIISVYIPEKVTKGYDVKYYYRAAQLVYARFRNLSNVILHANAPEQVFFAEEAKRLFQCPVVFTFHFLEGFLSYIDKKKLYKKANHLQGNILPGKMLNISDKIICVTKFAKRAVEKYYNIKTDKVTVIYNGRHKSNNVSEFNSKTELKLKYGFNADNIILLFAGPLNPRKGIDTLIKAFILIKDDYEKIKLVIVGSGEYDKFLSLAQECPGRICFTGKLNYEVLTEFYQLSDIGIIPSQYEQGGYVTIEMLQHNLPIIVSNVPGLNEMVIHGKTGLICKILPVDNEIQSLQADVYDLAKQLKYYLDNPVYAMQFSDKAFIENKEKFSLKTMSEKTLKIYNKLNESYN